MALMNTRLAPDIETVFMMASEAYSFLSSRLVKQVFGLGGNISGLVPPVVEERLKSRVREGRVTRRCRPLLDCLSGSRASTSPPPCR